MKKLKNLETAITMDITDYQSDNQIIEAELEIEKIISNGCGLARYSGRAVFIPFTAPGDVILAEIDLSGKKFLEGKILKILKSSPDRVEPVCPLYMKCGGCSLQHVSYEKQLEIRKELVLESFRRNGRISINEADIVPSGPYGYRCRIQLHPLGSSSDNSAGNRSGAGFRERQGKNVIEVKNCPVCNEGLNRFLTSSGNRIKERTVVFSPDSENVYLSSENNSLINVKLNNIDINTDPSSFFQSNIPVFEKAVDEIKKYASGNILLDLYSGAAVFGAALSENFSTVISVEENRAALKCGENNIKKREGLDAFFYPVSVEKFIKAQSINKDKSRGRRKDRGLISKAKTQIFNPDTVIADPPRTGLSKTVREYLKILKPDIFIYLSCDYTTMSRDLGDLCEKCYNIDKLKIFDFYPQTAHAETLAVLSRK